MEHKSEQVMQIALASGWKAQVKPVIPENLNADEIEWHLYAVRNQETFHVLWIGDRQTEAVYGYGDYRLYPARRAAVIKILKGRPDPKKLNKEETELLLEDRVLPWSQDSPAMDIMRAVLGRQITWVRKLDGEICSAVVVKSSNLGNKWFKVYDHANGRRLDWLDFEGFHTVAIEQIIGVD
jgi:hypothetical protein